MIKVFDGKVSATITMQENGQDITDTYLSAHYPDAKRRSLFGRVSYRFNDVSGCLNDCIEWGDESDKHDANVTFTSFRI